MILCAWITAGCGDTVNNDTVRYALEAEPATLDPAKSTALAESNVELALFEGLTRLDENEQPQPAAAERWEVSADGTEYTFHLRSGLVWNDGTPLTAHDFEYAWKRVLNPQTASENAERLLAELTLEYNKGRQEKITSEILDLESGEA